MNPYATARQAYAESAILTASPGRLVVMLYDGAIGSLRQSAAAMRAGDRERARARMRKAESIIDELNGSLDMDVGELPDKLRAIYNFCKRLLIRATGRVSGAITYGEIEIERGGKISGAIQAYGDGAISDAGRAAAAKALGMNGRRRKSANPRDYAETEIAEKNSGQPEESPLPGS